MGRRRPAIKRRIRRDGASGCKRCKGGDKEGNDDAKMAHLLDCMLHDQKGGLWLFKEEEREID